MPDQTPAGGRPPTATMRPGHRTRLEIKYHGTKFNIPIVSANLFIQERFPRMNEEVRSIVVGKNPAKTVMGAVVLLIAFTFLYMFITIAAVGTVQGYDVKAIFT
jgi:hypothetical protein